MWKKALIFTIIGIVALTSAVIALTTILFWAKLFYFVIFKL